MTWKNTHHSWGWTSIVIHWLAAAAIIFLFVLGLWMVGLDYYHSWYRTGPYIHKGLGVLLLLVTLFRLIWYLGHDRPQLLDTYTEIERKASKWVHGLMYMLMFAIILSGYLISTADGRSIEVFDWFELPALGYAVDNQEDMAGEVHFILSMVLILMVALHTVAAIKHHWIDKDVTLKRMLGIRS